MGERADTGPLARSAEDAALRARIEQQIGRNVLLYQRIELVLKKMLVMGARAEGPIDCIPARLEKRSRQVLQSTLGELAGRVFREVLGAPEAAADACTSNADSIRVSFSHVIEAAPGSNDFDRLQEALATLAQRRNFIVHQFLQDRTLTTADGRRAVLSALEDDHATAERLHGQLEVLADQMQAVLAARASFLQSDEFADALDDAVAEADVIRVMCDAAHERRHVGGWQWLDTARHRIRAGASSAQARLEARRGKQWLDQVLAGASDFFERETLPTPGGGPLQMRVRYRLKPDRPGEP